LALREDIAALEHQLAELLARTDGQILTTLNGVAVVRAAAFAAHTLPIECWLTPEHLYSATGLAPASYQSASVTRRGRISRQGLAEHRDALMAIAWSSRSTAPPSAGATANTAPAASDPSKPASPSPATPAAWLGDCYATNSPRPLDEVCAEPDHRRWCVHRFGVPPWRSRP
jgi:hypothetical protein